ncbi:MAG: FG-GAP-like repeat-containing protein, partial [bacterium]|nr:FG-GAP-like repeat-containing protein [bacterium]
HPDIRIERLSHTLVRVTDGNEVSVLGVGGNQLGDVKIEGDMYCLSLSEDTLCFAGVDRMDAKEYGGNPESLNITTDAIAGRLGAAIRNASVSKPEKQQASVPVQADSGLTLGWKQEIGGEISSLSVLDNTVLYGDRAGNVNQLALEDGATSWSVPVGSEVSQVMLGDLDGDGKAEAFAGTADSELVVLNGTDGAEVWRKKLKNMSIRGGHVTVLTLADLEGDGRTSVLAGTAGWFVNAFTPDGTRIWAEWFRYHAIRDFRVADVDGDGKAEVMVGTEYSTPLTVHNFDGSFRWSTFEEVGSEGNASTPRRGIQLNRMALLDVDGDGVQEILYGTGDGWIFSVKPQDGAECWQLNLTGEVTGLVATTEGIFAANEYGDLYRLGPDGNVLWRVRASRWIREVVLVGDRLVVAGEEGRLMVFDSSGACNGAISLDAEIVFLKSHKSGVVAALANHQVVRVDLSK